MTTTKATAADQLSTKGFEIFCKALGYSKTLRKAREYNRALKGNHPKVMRLINIHARPTGQNIGMSAKCSSSWHEPGPINDEGRYWVHHICDEGLFLLPSLPANAENVEVGGYNTSEPEVRYSVSVVERGTRIDWKCKRFFQKLIRL